MTKKHFIEAAEIVRNIVEGKWTNDPPSWADRARYDASDFYFDHEGELTGRYTRAVQTAEAFITLFRSFNPRFDESRFLVACGLAEQPAKVRRAR